MNIISRIYNSRTRDMQIFYTSVDVHACRRSVKTSLRLVELGRLMFYSCYMFLAPLTETITYLHREARSKRWMHARRKKRRMSQKREVNHMWDTTYSQQQEESHTTHKSSWIKLNYVVNNILVIRTSCGDKYHTHTFHLTHSIKQANFCKIIHIVLLFIYLCIFWV